MFLQAVYLLVLSGSIVGLSIGLYYHNKRKTINLFGN